MLSKHTKKFILIFFNFACFFYNFPEIRASNRPERDSSQTERAIRDAQTHRTYASDQGLLYDEGRQHRVYHILDHIWDDQRRQCATQTIGGLPIREVVTYLHDDLMNVPTGRLNQVYNQDPIGFIDLIYEKIIEGHGGSRRTFLNNFTDGTPRIYTPNFTIELHNHNYNIQVDYDGDKNYTIKIEPSGNGSRIVGFQRLRRLSCYSYILVFKINRKHKTFWPMTFHADN